MFPSNQFWQSWSVFFKVSEAPAFAKLLALADLGGMADLLKGEGLSFDTLEIKFNSEAIAVTSAIKNIVR